MSRGKCPEKGPEKSLQMASINPCKRKADQSDKECPPTSPCADSAKKVKSNPGGFLYYDCTDGGRIEVEDEVEEADKQLVANGRPPMNTCGKPTASLGGHTVHVRFTQEGKPVVGDVTFNVLEVSKNNLSSLKAVGWEGKLAGKYDEELQVLRVDCERDLGFWLEVHIGEEGDEEEEEPVRKKKMFPICQFCQAEGVWRAIHGTMGARCPKCSATVRCTKCGLGRTREHGEDQCNRCRGVGHTGTYVSCANYSPTSPCYVHASESESDDNDA